MNGRAPGQRRLERRVAIRRSDMLEHAPVTARAVGSSLPLLELMRAVVEQSDNPAANILIRELGGLAALRRWHASIGDRVTRLDRIELALNRVGPGDPRDTTAPAQAVANLRTLFASQRLPAADRGRLIQWMIDSPTGPNRIRAAAPRGAAVAHKTGTAGSYGHTNDIGLVWPRGRDKPAVSVAAYYSDATRIDLATRENVLSAAVRAGFAALGA